MYDLTRGRLAVECHTLITAAKYKHQSKIYYTPHPQTSDTYLQNSGVDTHAHSKSTCCHLLAREGLTTGLGGLAS